MNLLKMGHIWTTLALFLIFFNAKVSPEAWPVFWCCNFEFDVCSWSPEDINDGWIYSKVNVDPIINNITMYPYIYVRDTSAVAYSPVLSEIPDTAYFTISYYFNTTIDPYNTLKASFQNDNGTVTYLYSDDSLPTTESTFQYLNLDGYGLCSGDTIPCSGKFFLTTTNYQGVSLSAALQYFTIAPDTC